LQLIDRRLDAETRAVRLDVPLSDGRTLAWIYAHGEVIGRRDDSEAAHLSCAVRSRSRPPPPTASGCTSDSRELILLGPVWQSAVERNEHSREAPRGRAIRPSALLLVVLALLAAGCSETFSRPAAGHRQCRSDCSGSPRRSRGEVRRISSGAYANDAFARAMLDDGYSLIYTNCQEYFREAGKTQQIPDR